MPAVLLDTHAWVWSFADDSLLSPAARAAILSAEAVLVSPISFFEIGQKVRIGKWPEMAGMVSDLPQILRDQGGLLAPFTPEISLHAALWDWVHRDPFDRIIGATAAEAGLPLITRDAAFAGRSELQIVW
ncbi:type II toxin-antitoxin system VapC family toxin [Salipiger sp. P9]|uniref:type II toxin-antitoxin system VapC family toxin n=1 Tax=Salipiger pentaromativorans TaxID=2943193 RepID=UPI0021585E24|nr:type II toxin-antitoxin system VapC family toxin [Salipiger pentaromativorans]MCR8550555.1 type II toxin-antitoxin system VapC family toxin [Salipiger pentaromativorans]